MDKKLDMYISNLKAIEGRHKWHRGTETKLAALMYTLENKTADMTVFEETRELIKDSFSMFSAFRGHLNLCVTAMTAMSGNPEKTVEKTLQAYDLLCKEKFIRSDFLAAAALQIAVNTEDDKLPETVDRTKAFYKGMKDKHWFLTGENDYIFSAMLALSRIDPADGAVRIEEMFNRVKKVYAASYSSQALAQILVLGGQNPDVVDKVRSLGKMFREQGLKMDKYYTLPALGAISLLDDEPDKIVDLMKNVKEFLKKQKGFGSLSISGQERLLYASGLVTSFCASEMKGEMGAVLSTTLTSIIIAEEIAMLVACVSASAAAASGS